VKTYSSRNGLSTTWEEPLVAFADAKDPLFSKLKEFVDVNHLLPNDLQAGASTVISYFLPFIKKTTLSNTDFPDASLEWAKAYMETNQLIFSLNKALAEIIKQNYSEAATVPTTNFDQEKLVCDWSQKHVAYIAGLGKFGLHHMLITQKGCCGRFGSVVTTAKLKPTRRSNHEYCLYKLNGSCGICVRKCRTKALRVNGLDKKACYKECLRNAEKYRAVGMADVCGKCVSNIPCSFTNPSKDKHPGK